MRMKKKTWAWGGLILILLVGWWGYTSSYFSGGNEGAEGINGANGANGVGETDKSGSSGASQHNAASDVASGPAGKNSRGGAGGLSNRPLPVQVATIQQGDMDVTLRALGTVTARNTAIVKARVAGQLVRVVFQEGQVVKAGALLAEIDPRPYQAQFDQASGQLARDEALLANARVDLARYRELYKQDSIARQQMENQEWLVKQYEGTVSNDRGALEAARLQLGFTRISAPFDGRVGLRQVDVGNYVQTSDPNGIVTMTQTHPVHVMFSIPADQLPRVLESLQKGQPMAVDALDSSHTQVLARGKLSSVDNQVDLATGTIKLKAVFENTNDRLFPNQFVNARLQVATQHAAVLAPTAAIQRGNNGTFVYVVGADHKVMARSVSTGVTSHDQVAIVQGLAVGEQVVIDGADKLREGAQVDISTPGAGKSPVGESVPSGAGQSRRSGRHAPPTVSGKVS